jgi:hypothetical protein
MACPAKHHLPGHCQLMQAALLREQRHVSLQVMLVTLHVLCLLAGTLHPALLHVTRP